MLILLLVSLLLIYLTLNMGILARELLSRLFHTPLQTDLLELFLMGLMLSSFYFNMLSFWLPVNYWTLIPPALLSIGVTFLCKEKTKTVWISIRHNLSLFFSSRRWLMTCIIGSVLVVYWILPCGTEDSMFYHFQAIAWYEKYKVVPGLANLNGRLGFNPASFIIQSAYSFSGPVGEHLYPLNGVTAAFLFSWLLVRVYRTDKALVSLLYSALIILVFRHTLIDVNSPSSDGLSVTCMLYIFVRLAEYSLSTDRNRSGAIVPVLVILYGITIKPATFAMLLALPYLFFILPKTQRTAGLIFQAALTGILIYLPWLARNYILSGYFVFPFSLTGILHPDWKVPLDVVKMELYNINIFPKIDFDWTAASVARSHTFFGWFMPWLRSSLDRRLMDIVFLFPALLSPLYWLVRLRFKKGWSPLFPVWTIAFVATLAWMQAAPVFRFGSTYVYMSFILPAFDLAHSFLSRPSGRPGLALTALQRYTPAFMLLAFTCTGVYYIRTGFTRGSTYRFTLVDCWLKPLKAWVYNDSQKADFPYRTLKNGTKLYVADSTHECINACEPCAEFDYGKVEMRGDSLDQGFRNVHDEVKLHYPGYVE